MSIFALKALRGDSTTTLDEVQHGASATSAANDADSDSSSSVESVDSARKRVMEEKPFQTVGPDKDLITEGFHFSGAVAASTLLNLAILGTEVDVRCNGSNCTRSTMDEFWDGLQHAFTALFTLEVAIRICIAGPERYFRGTKDVKYAKYRMDYLNCVDFLLVFLRILDCWVLGPAGVVSGLGILSGFRVVQIFMFVRKIKHNKTFRELWLVISSLAETVKTIAWVFILLICVMWLCGVLITMAVNSMSESEALDFSRGAWTREEYWGTVGRSVISLFQVMTRDKWADSLIWPLVSKNIGILLLIVCFLIISVLSLMNSITGIVVESTLSSSKLNDEAERKERDKLDQKVMTSLSEVLSEITEDNSGPELFKEDLHDFLSQLRVRDRLRWLEIPLRDIEMLFDLLDEGETGHCDKYRFLRGITRIRGQAAASDLHQMSIDLGLHLDWCRRNHKNVETLNAQLAALVDVTDEVDTEIVRNEQDTKDPVRTGRRSRPKIAMSQLIREAGSKGPLPKMQSDPWDNFQLDGPRGSMKGELSAAMIGKALYEASLQKQMSEDEHKELARMTPEQKRLQAQRREAAEAKRQKKITVTDQPEPPPLPEHLQMVIAQKEKEKAKAAKQTQKKKEAKKSRFSFAFG